MENSSRPPYEDDKPKDLTPPEEKRRFWENLFADEEEEEKEAEEEKAPEASPATPSQRLRGFLNNIVRPEKLDKETPQPEIQELPEESVEPATPDYLIDFSKEITQPVSEQPNNLAEPEPSQLLNNQSEVGPVFDTELPNTNEQTEKVLPPSESLKIDSEASMASTVPERVVEMRPAKAAAEKDVIIEKHSGGAWLAFLGANFLRRRSERKIKRAGERLEKRVEQGEKARDRLELIARKTAAELEAVKQRQQSFEHGPISAAALNTRQGEIPKPQPSELQPAQIPALEMIKQVSSEVQPSPEMRKYQEALIEPARRASEDLRTEIREYKKPQTDKLPEKVLEVIEAAKQNRPLEKLYELRQEVKDEAKAPGAAAIGAVIADRRREFSQPSFSGLQPINTTTKPPVSLAPPPATYKQAMKMGFWAALATIALGLIVYFGLFK